MRRHTYWVVALAVVCFARTGPASAEQIPETSAFRIQTLRQAMFEHMGRQTEHWWHNTAHDRVVELLRVQIRLQPERTDLYANLAWLESSAGLRHLAVDTLIRALRRNPDDGDAWAEWGRYQFMRLRDYPGAIESFRQAARLRKDWLDWNSIAMCYYRMGAWREARAVWTDLLYLFPGLDGNQHDVIIKHIENCDAKLQEGTATP